MVAARPNGGARAAVADTRGAAHALARFAARPSLVVPEGESAERINSLPVAALRLGPSMVADLRKLGFQRVSDLLATPRASLTLRFGPELGLRWQEPRRRRGPNLWDAVRWRNDKSDQGTVSEADGPEFTLKWDSRSEGQGL